MKAKIEPKVKVSSAITPGGTYAKACEFAAEIMKKNITMLSELTPKAIEKYELVKVAKFYEERKYSELSYTDINVEKLIEDFIKIDGVLCVDESYFFKELSDTHYGFMAIGIPFERSEANDTLVEYSVTNVSGLIGVLPDSFRFLYKNLGGSRLARLEN